MQVSDSKSVLALLEGQSSPAEHGDTLGRADWSSLKVRGLKPGFLLYITETILVMRAS